MNDIEIAARIEALEKQVQELEGRLPATLLTPPWPDPGIGSATTNIPFATTTTV